MSQRHRNQGSDGFDVDTPKCRASRTVGCWSGGRHRGLALGGSGSNERRDWAISSPLGPPQSLPRRPPSVCRPPSAPGYPSTSDAGAEPCGQPSRQAPRCLLHGCGGSAVASSIGTGPNGRRRRVASRSQRSAVGPRSPGDCAPNSPTIAASFCQEARFHVKRRWIETGCPPRQWSPGPLATNISARASLFRPCPEMLSFAAPGSRLPAPGSRLPAPGSRLPAPGSRLPAPGSRLPAPGSRLPAPGSRLPAPGSRLPAPGSRLPAPGSRLPAPGSRLPAPGSRLPAPGSRLPAPGSRLPAPGSRLPAPGSDGLSPRRSSTVGLVSRETGASIRASVHPPAGPNRRSESKASGVPPGIARLTSIREEA